MTLRIFENLDKIHDNEKTTRISNSTMLRGLKQPYRMLIYGKSGSGKTSLIKNIIEQTKPEIIYLSHAESEESNDYVDVPHINLDLINDDENQSLMARFRQYSEVNKLWIIDDYPFFKMSKKDLLQFSQALTYISSHTNTSIICSVQDLLLLPPYIRRMFQVCIIFKNNDITAISIIVRKLSSVLNKKEIETCFNNLLKSKHDFVFIDEVRNAAWSVVNNHMILIKNNNA